MIKRKIISTEYSALVVLPRYWVEQQGFNKDNRYVEIFILPDGSLLLKKMTEDVHDQAQVGKYVIIFYDDLGYVSRKEGVLTSVSDMDYTLNDQMIIPKNRVFRVEVRK